MSTIGYVFVFLGFLVFSEVARGRVKHLMEDLSSLMTGLITGDQKRVRETLSVRGETNDTPTIDSGPPVGITGNSSIVAEVQRLGSGKPYKYGHSGPDGYDCSGLVWRAMRNLGIYNGPRFTTDTFPAVARGLGMKTTDQPTVGDVVLWHGSGPNGHMGIVTGNDRYYSARSTKSGIGESTISGHGGNPVYYHLSASISQPAPDKLNGPR